MTRKQLTPVEVLRESARLIQEIGWCRGSYARDAEGNSADAASPNAVSFCAIGAMQRAAGMRRNGILPVRGQLAYHCARQFLQKALQVPPEGIPKWNDTRERKREIVAAFKKAIKLAEKAGG